MNQNGNQSLGHASVTALRCSKISGAAKLALHRQAALFLSLLFGLQKKEIHKIIIFSKRLLIGKKL
jgi:hypothetical protein